MKYIHRVITAAKQGATAEAEKAHIERNRFVIDMTIDRLKKHPHSWGELVNGIFIFCNQTAKVVLITASPDMVKHFVEVQGFITSTAAAMSDKEMTFLASKMQKELVHMNPEFRKQMMKLTEAA